MALLVLKTTLKLVGLINLLVVMRAVNVKVTPVLLFCANRYQLTECEIFCVPLLYVEMVSHYLQPSNIYRNADIKIQIYSQKNYTSAGPKNRQT